MGKSRTVKTHFWNDTFVGQLEADDKLLFLYLITNPLTNMLGVYEIQKRRISFDTDLSLERVTEGLETLKSAEKVDYIDGYIVLANFVKNQNYNTNMLKSAVSDMDDLPHSVLQSPFFETIMEWFRRVPKRHEMVRKIEVEIESEVEEETEDKKKSPIARVKGCPIPEPLQIEGFAERYESFWDYLKETKKLQSSIPAVESHFRRLIELKNKGNPPLAVIDQTMNAGNKSFYPLKDQEFKSNQESKNYGTPDLNAISSDIDEILAGREAAAQASGSK